MVVVAGRVRASTQASLPQTINCSNIWVLVRFLSDVSMLDCGETLRSMDSSCAASAAAALLVLEQHHETYYTLSPASDYISTTLCTERSRILLINFDRVGCCRWERRYSYH